MHNSRHVIFENRKDAGQYLAQKLDEYLGCSVLVLAIPNGGVPVALEVASKLKAELDLIICRKIPLPLAPEGGFGACADDGTVILNEDIVKRVGLSRSQIEHEANKVRTEIKQRVLLHKGDRPLIGMSGKIVIIIDDGLASGITMTAAVESVRRRRPSKIVVAVPCASALAFKQVQKFADEVIAVNIGYMPRFAVADFYHHWYDLGDDQVVRLLEQWRTQRFLTNIDPLHDK